MLIVVMFSYSNKPYQAKLYDLPAPCEGIILLVMEVTVRISINFAANLHPPHRAHTDVCLRWSKKIPHPCKLLVNPENETLSCQTATLKLLQVATGIAIELINILGIMTKPYEKQL
jgi:hypothetical protein